MLTILPATFDADLDEESACRCWRGGGRLKMPPLSSRRWFKLRSAPERARFGGMSGEI